MLGLNGAIANVKLLSGLDVEAADRIELTHGKLRKAAAKALSKNCITVILGGGHDFGFPQCAAAFDAYGSGYGCINIDAHLDVRPPNDAGITSGSPFYLALESGVLLPKNFVEFGIQEHANDKSFHDYLKKKKVRVLTLEQTRSGSGVLSSFKKVFQEFKKRKLKIVVSIDVDAVQMSQCPGVSSPQVDGFTAREIFEIIQFCGGEKDVVSVGFFEASPPLDFQQQTVRFTATAIHRYLSSLGNA